MSLNLNHTQKIFVFIFFVLLFSACNNTTNSKINNAENEIRIVSLVPSITQELVSLNLTKNIVGATSYCSVSATNKELIVGSAIEVNIEKVLLLKPDIVFASDLTKQKDLAALKDNGIKVHFLSKMKSFNDICEHFIKLGKAVGKAELVKNMVENSRKKVDSLKNIVPALPDSLSVFFQIGSKPIFTVIPHTFMNDYITFAACKNIASDLNHGTITRESVLQRNPDIIFVTTMGVAGTNEKNIWESYTDLKASKNKKIFVIDANMASSPTVLSFTKTLEIVIDKIYALHD